MIYKKISNTVGNKSDFAIQYEINNFYYPFIYGKYCYYINNIQIGNYDEGVTFNDLLCTFTDILYFKDLRANKQLFNLNLKDFLNSISVENDFYANLVITPLIDIFLNVDVYLVEYENKARFIIRDLENNIVFDYFSKVGVFNEVFNTIYIELNEYFDKFINQTIRHYNLL